MAERTVDEQSVSATSPGRTASGSASQPLAMPYGRRERFDGATWAVLLALAPGFVLAALLGVASPLEPVSEWIMQVTPVSLANVLLQIVGPFSGFIALLGAIAICLPVAGVLALLAPGVAAHTAVSRRVWYMRWLLVTALSIALAVLLGRAAATRAEAFATLVVGLALPPALAGTRRWRRQLLRLSGSGRRRRDVSGTSRRTFLRQTCALGINAAGLAALSAFGIWSVAADAALGRASAARRFFAFAPPAPRQPGFPVAGEEPEVTAAANFYRISKNADDPLVASDGWSLQVTGAVRQPFTLTYPALLGLPRHDEYVTLRCVDNLPSSHLMSTGYFSGVPLASLLGQAQLAPNAIALAFSAPDGYQEILPLADALHPGALLAYALDGVELARAHGGPVRAVVPGFFGFKNVKWIQRITVLTHAESGYWAQRGWTAAQIHSVARIDVWHPVSGGVLVAGVAFAGTQGVSRVQVRADGAAWHDAALHTPALSPWTWVQWRATLPLGAGQHTLVARMTDGAGHEQEAATNTIYPGGATGLDTLTLTL